MKALYAIAPVAAGAVLVLALSTGAFGKGGRPAWTVHVIEHATTDAVTNPGSAGKADNVGDLLTFNNEVFDKTDSSHSGHDQGFCVRTIAGVAFECWWTTFLAGGQITVEGPFYDTRNSRLAVTGGTGVYANATGWMELNFRENGAKFDFIFHLSR